MPVKMENLGELSLNPLMSRDNCQLFDVDVAIEELTKYRALGGETVVDPTNIGIGRDPKALARIARLAGAPKVQGAGVDLLHKLGAGVSQGQPLYRVYAAYAADLEFARQACLRSNGFTLGRAEELAPLFVEC